MVKKKQSKADAPDAPEVPEVPEVPEAQKEFYKVGAWAGITQYRCTLCAFDTLEKPAMLEHLFEAHEVQAEEFIPTLPLTPAPLPKGEGKEGEGETFEVELKEIGETVDEDGSVHKKFTIKE